MKCDCTEDCSYDPDSFEDLLQHLAGETPDPSGTDTDQGGSS